MIGLYLLLFATLRPDVTWVSDYVLTADSLPVTFTVWEAAQIPGDFDADGDVDGDDFLIWQAAYVAGTMTGIQFLIWQNHYGEQWRLSAHGLSLDGTVTADWANNTLTYTPGPDFDGEDRILWNVTPDGQQVRAGFVRVEVQQ